MNNLNSDISLSKEEIAAMEPITYPGTIVVVQSEEGACKAVEYLRMQSYIGFDTETKPAFKKGQINKVALLQLSGGDYCFLFRLNKIGFPECVIKLLSDKNILKIGLSLKDDYATMRRLAKIEPDGFIELQNFVKKYGIPEASLQKIFARLFKRKISKSQRLSNWESEELSDAQKKYAATDAWACVCIYEKLLNQEND